MISKTRRNPSVPATTSRGTTVIPAAAAMIPMTGETRAVTVETPMVTANHPTPDSDSGGDGGLPADDGGGGGDEGPDLVGGRLTCQVLDALRWVILGDDDDADPPSPRFPD